MSALFAEVLVKPPYLWGFDALGYVFAGQVAAAVAVPFFCGNLSDIIVKILSKKNGGVSHVRRTPASYTLKHTNKSARVPTTRYYYPATFYSYFDHHLWYDSAKSNTVELGWHRGNVEL